MKQRLLFALIMGIITTGTISFSLVALNYGFKAGFFKIMLRSWLVSYMLAVSLILLLGPRIQALTNYFIHKIETYKKKRQVERITKS